MLPYKDPFCSHINETKCACVCVCVYLSITVLYYARCPKKFKLLKLSIPFEKCFGNIYLKMAELKNVLSQFVNYV